MKYPHAASGPKGWALSSRRMSISDSSSRKSTTRAAVYDGDWCCIYCRSAVRFCGTQWSLCVLTPSWRTTSRLSAWPISLSVSSIVYDIFKALHYFMSSHLDSSYFLHDNPPSRRADHILPVQSIKPSSSSHIGRSSTSTSWIRWPCGSCRTSERAKSSP